VPPAVALMNYISSGILWRIFSQTEIFAGFSLYIIHRKEQRNCDIAGDIIFFSLAGPVGDYTGVHNVIFRCKFSIFYSPELSAKLRSSGEQGTFLVTRSSFSYVPLLSVWLDLGDFSSHSDFSRI
jgi:hypothetical protein